MNNDIVKGKWKEIKGKVQQQWSKLTDDEVGEMKGDYNELAGKLQQKYGYGKEEAKKQIEEFLNKSKPNK